MDSSVCNKSVLIVDDEKDVLSLLQDILKDICSSIFVAEDGDKGMELFLQENPSVVISDIHMPKFSGLEFLQKLREMNYDTPFIVITGFGKVEEAVLALRFGAFDFIQKPLEPQSIIMTVQNALNISQLLQEAEQEALQMLLQEKENNNSLPSLRMLLAAKHVAFMRKLREHYKYKKDTST